MLSHLRGRCRGRLLSHLRGLARLGSRLKRLPRLIARLGRRRCHGLHQTRLRCPIVTRSLGRETTRLKLIPRGFVALRGR